MKGRLLGWKRGKAETLGSLALPRKPLTARELIAALQALPDTAKDMPVMVDYNCSAGRTPVYSVFGDGDEAYPYVMLSGE